MGGERQYRLGREREGAGLREEGVAIETGRCQQQGEPGLERRRLDLQRGVGLG